MINVKTKNRNIILAMLLLLIGCKENKTHQTQKQEVIKKPLVFNVEFKTFGETELAYNQEKKQIDESVWKNHYQDSVVYFNINLERKIIVLKTQLVATKIPFLLKYNEGKESGLILEVVQQFNTIYSDSIIFKKGVDSLIVDQAFRIDYQHNGNNNIHRLQVNQHHDTIDISNQN
jgi:hypothetical protein